MPPRVKIDRRSIRGIACAIKRGSTRSSQSTRFCILISLLLCAACLCSHAATRDADSLDQSAASQTQDKTQAAPSSNPSPASAEPAKKEENEGESKKKKEKSHNGSFVAAPLPIVSPALGSGIVPVLGYIFPLQEKDPSSPPSVVGAGGLITNNGTRGFGVGGDLYLDDARYELKSFYMRGNINYNLYGLGFLNGNKGIKIPLQQTGEAFFIKFLRNIGWNVYAGGRFFTGNSFVTLRLPSTFPFQIPPGIGLQTNLRALGVEVSRDTRPNRFYPVKGSWIDFTGDFFMQSLSSKYSFQSYKFTFDKYFSLSPKQVLAYNLYWCGTGGSPPFYGNCIYGANDELRGYTAGRYLDRFMLASQLEYRLVLPWRFGVVGFAGIGGVAPGVDSFRGNQLLPGGGTGIRYMLSKKYHVNLRTDFAWGKDNFTWGVGVGEAF